MRIAVVTPWFPSEESPYSGIFVRQWLDALALPATDVLVVHARSIPADEPAAVERTEEPYGTLVRIGVPHEPMLSRAETAVLHRDALATHVEHELVDADVVHAHVGMPTGWAVVDLVGGRSRVLTIEHATYARGLLSHPTAAPVYEAMLRGTDAHLVVGEDTARSIRRRWPDLAPVTVAVGNPVDDSLFALREDRPARLDRWLFIGNLIERKGVMRALEAFAHHASRRSEAHFTIVGSGPQLDELSDRAADLGVSDRVEFLGARTPDELPALMAQHHVLVHLAHHETFGLTVVEAAATGMPVVVTRCQGPEETLAGAARHRQAAFVDVSDETDDVLAAVDDLEASSGVADPAAARATVVRWYGVGQFGSRLRQASRGLPFYEEPPQGSPVTVIVALTRDGARHVRYTVAELARRGQAVRFVTARVDEARMADSRARPLDLRPQLNRRLIFKAEMGLTSVIPEAAATLAKRGMTPIAGRSGGLGRVGRGGIAVTNRGLTRWRRTRARGESALVSAYVKGRRAHELATRIDAGWFEGITGPVEAVLAADGPSLEVAHALAERWEAAVVVGPDRIGPYVTGGERATD